MVITKQISAPPSNIDSEKALLGSILLDPNVLSKVRKLVKPESFYSNAHKIIYWALCDLEDRETPIDMLTLKTRLENGKKLELIGGLSYIAEIISSVPTSLNAVHYAKIIKEKFKARKTIETSDDIKKLINESDSVDKNVKQAIEGLYEALKDDDNSMSQMDRLKEIAKEYTGDDKVVSFKEVFDSLGKDTVERLYTGWEQLDGLLKGFRPKHLIVLSGIMKHGKTSFAMDMTVKMQKYNPLWLAIEEPVDELMEKFLERGEQPPQGFSPKNVSFVDTDWVERKIVEGIVNFDSKMVFIDNLDWVSPRKGFRSDNKAEKIEQTIRELKALAKKWNIVIVLIVHVTKSSKVDSNPTFEDFKGSVTIGQVADKAILIWRETERGDKGELNISNNTNVSVQLNRQGQTGNIKMVYNNGHYTEFDWKQDKEDKEFGDFAGKPRTISYPHH